MWGFGISTQSEENGKAAPVQHLIKLCIQNKAGVPIPKAATTIWESIVPKNRNRAVVQ